MMTKWVINSIGTIRTEADGSISTPATLANLDGSALGNFELRQNGSNVVAIRIPQMDMYIINIEDIKGLKNGSIISVGPAVPQSNNR